MWLYKDVEVKTLPDDCVGFVYIITNLKTNRKYVGKKLAKFSKTTYKTVVLKNGKKKSFEYWDDVQGYWFSRCQIDDYLDCIVVKDKQKPKSKGFG